MIKLVCFLKRKPELTHEEFIDHWLNRHAPLIAGTPELARHLIRYEQLQPTAYASWMGSEGYDGITLQWMSGPEAFEAFIGEPTYQELVAPDEKRFLDTSALVWMITEEPVVAIDGATV
jgi:hypothetical protein